MSAQRATKLTVLLLILPLILALGAAPAEAKRKKHRRLPLISTGTTYMDTHYTITVRAGKAKGKWLELQHLGGYGYLTYKKVRLTKKRRSLTYTGYGYDLRYGEYWRAKVGRATRVLHPRPLPWNYGARLVLSGAPTSLHVGDYHRIDARVIRNGRTAPLYADHVYLYSRQAGATTWSPWNDWCDRCEPDGHFMEMGHAAWGFDRSTVTAPDQTPGTYEYRSKVVDRGVAMYSNIVTVKLLP